MSEEHTPKQLARREEIVKDIIKKRPEAYGCTYEVETYYDYERNYERKRMVPNKQFFGYDPEELVKLDLHEGGWRMTDMIRSVFDKATVQKANRFEERIVDPLRSHISNAGVEGLYKVQTGDGGVGFVYAKNLNEAKRVADVTFGFLISGKVDRWGEPRSLSVRWARRGTPGDIGANNKDDVERIRSRIARAKETIETANRNIAQYEAELMAIQMSELSQLDSSYEPGDE